MKNIFDIDNSIKDSDTGFDYKLSGIKFYQKQQHIIKYAVIGITGVTIDYLIFIFLTQKLKFNYQIANMISVTIGITNNFILNYFLNFKVRGSFMKRLIRFYSVGLFGLLLNAGILFILIQRISLPANISKLCALIIVVCIQFVLNSKFTFR